MSTPPPYILFLSFIYIKNVYSRREGHVVKSVWPGGEGEGRMLEEGGERRRAGGGRRGAGRGGGEAEEWEQRRKREGGAGSGGRAKGEGVQPERAEQRGASEGRRQPPGRGAGLWSTAARGLEPF